MEILLTPITERRRGQEEIVASIRRAIADVPAAEIQLYASSSNMMMRMMRGGQDARLVVEIRGHDLDQGNELAQRVIDAMAAVPGVVHPRLDREAGQLERTLRVDRARLAELGLNGSQVADAVEHYVLGRVATRFRDQGDEFDIRGPAPAGGPAAPRAATATAHRHPVRRRCPPGLDREHRSRRGAAVHQP